MKNTENIKLFGYTTYQINSSEERHDGSAILVKTTMKHKLMNNFITDVLAITVETHTGPITVATTYLPPRRPYLPYPDFHSLASNNNPTYIIGDFNAKHTCLGDNYNNTVGAGIKTMMDHKLLHHLGPTFCTYYSTNARTTPDIILANKHTYHNVTSEPGPDTASDHIPIIFTITSRAITTQVNPRPDHKRANWDSFKNTVRLNIGQATPPANATTSQIDNAIQSWFRVITEAMNENIPQTTHITLVKPITNSTIKSIQTCIANLKMHANTIGWTSSKLKAYKALRRALVKECQKLQVKHWENKILHIAKKYKAPDQFWKHIKQLKGSKNIISPYITYNNNDIYSPEKKELVFRNIWRNIFHINEDENRNFDDHNNTRVNNYINLNLNQSNPFPNADLTRLNNNNYLARPISLAEIESIIKQLKNNAPGNSFISKLILTKLPNEAIESLANIYNLTLSLGYYPEKFKVAKVILIPKPGKKGTNPLDYRPISLLEVPGKILEKIINTRLRNHLEINNILSASQHGFRQTRGTETALAVTMETIAQALSQKKQCYIVLRDVSKAFDKIWYNGLKFKILRLQLPPTFTKILCTFLDRRIATISIGNHLGPPFSIRSGVPQGSPLSPTLYSLYTADLPAASPGSTNIIYADDITQIITHPSKSKKIMARRVQTEINKINSYETLWKIKTNTSKFKIIPLATKATEPITINHTQIPYSKDGNILGLHINKTGILGHVTHTRNKAIQALSTLRRFTAMPEKIKIHLIKAFIIPILTYPAYPLNVLSKTATLKLQRIQNSALRFAYNEKYPYTNTTEELHRKADLMPINIITYHRGRKIMNKLLTSINDTTYNNIIANDDTQEHSWFRKSFRTLIGPEPPPHIYRHIIQSTLLHCTSLSYQRK